MLIQQFNGLTAHEDWLEARRGKLTGSKVKDVFIKRGNKEKIGYYSIIAERLATKPMGGNPMIRGSQLEGEALERFSTETQKKLNTSLVLWQDESLPFIAISPDAYIDGEKITEAVEAKCLDSSRHVEALILQEVPADHKLQVMWYFVVNPDLEKLYLCFYDPRFIVYDFFYLTVRRSDYGEEIDELKQEMIAKLKSIDEQVARLTKGTPLEF